MREFLRKVKSPKTEDRRQKSEDRSPKSEACLPEGRSEDCWYRR
ncbi:MAG: hypothetical protein R6V74_03740 [Lutibacter sp.]